MSNSDTQNSSARHPLEEIADFLDRAYESWRRFFERETDIEQHIDEMSEVAKGGRKKR